MATYRAIAATETDPEAPITSSLMKALDENVAATAEQAAGAPKIKQINIISGAPATSQTFTGLGDYSGVEFTASVFLSVAAQTFSIEYSTNGGSTWSAATVIFTGSGTHGFVGSGFLDFATGNVGWVSNHQQGATTNTPIRFSGTMAGASLSINAVRFNSGNQVAVMLRPNGGTA